MTYVPLLRVQQSEYLALGSLAEDVADVVFPLMYQTPSGDDDPEETALRRLELLSRQWSRHALYDPYLCVVHDGADGRQLYAAAAEYGYAPVVHLDPGNAMQATEAADAVGRAGLRVTDPYVVLDPDLEDLVAACLTNVGLGPDDITLVFDLGPSDDVRAALAATRFPRLDEWRDVVLAAGEFVPVQQPTESFIARTHLQNWHRVRDEVSRDVLFGDYGTLAAEYQEPVSFPPAAKLVYTEPEGWFYARGRSIVTHGNEQIFELAEAVRRRDRWRGRDFSWGDEWIDDRAAHRPSAGNAAMWIRAALSHHITHVVQIDI